MTINPPKRRRVYMMVWSTWSSKRVPCWPALRTDRWIEICHCARSFLERDFWFGFLPAYETMPISVIMLVHKYYDTLTLLVNDYINLHQAAHPWYPWHFLKTTKLRFQPSVAPPLVLLSILAPSLGPPLMLMHRPCSPVWTGALRSRADCWTPLANQRTYDIAPQRLTSYALIEFEYDIVVINTKFKRAGSKPRFWHCRRIRGNRGNILYDIFDIFWHFVGIF